MGVTEPDKLSVTLSTVIANIIAKKDFDPIAGIIHHSEGVDLYELYLSEVLFPLRLVRLCIFLLA